MNASVCACHLNRCKRLAVGERTPDGFCSRENKKYFTGTFDAARTLIFNGGMPEGTDFDSLVTCYYKPLYQFAFSLARDEAEACDLTQQTFCIWAAKGHQLRDITKVKTWLFTTLHREFLGTRRRQTRFPHIEIEQAAPELPAVAPDAVSRIDCGQVLNALAKLDELYQAPVALFYLQDCSYNEIAEILDVPLGTVKSRLTRGLERLHQMLADAPPRQP